MSGGLYRNLQDALVPELRLLLEYGHTYTSRNGAMRELTARAITFSAPWERFQTLAERHANPIAQIAETLWVLNGSNDVNWLEYYLPRAKDFSDDGKTWRAGYGPRLRRWSGHGKGRHAVDQVMKTLEILRADPASRRAVMSIWDPGADYANSKDIPCNNWIQWLVRDGKLNMHIAVRSNDVIWGWSGINAFEWSVLQEVMAETLRLDVGYAAYFIGSFHLYEQHYERAKRITTARQRNRRYPIYAGGTTRPNLGLTLMDLDAWLASTFFGQEQAIRRDPAALDTILPLGDGSAPADWLRALDVYSRVKQADIPMADVVARVCRITRDDMASAIMEWLVRQPQYKAELHTIVSANIPEDAIWGLVQRLQAAKGKLYGDSWKKYGEKGSIFPNIARKYDRLENIHNGATPSHSETLLDTILDLGVYATLYYGYLNLEDFDSALHDVRQRAQTWEYADSWATIVTAFRYIAFSLGIVTTPQYAEVATEFHSLEDAVISLATSAFVWANAFRGYESWNKFIRDVDALTPTEEVAS